MLNIRGGVLASLNVDFQEEQSFSKCKWIVFQELSRFMRLWIHISFASPVALCFELRKRRHSNFRHIIYTLFIHFVYSFLYILLVLMFFAALRARSVMAHPHISTSAKKVQADQEGWYFGDPRAQAPREKERH